MHPMLAFRHHSVNAGTSMPTALAGIYRRRSELPTWIIPLAYSVTAIVAGWAVPRIETTLFPNLAAPMTVDVAIAIYSVVATGMIALTGIVFSLIFLTIQFSATAYSPRLALRMSRDPLLFHALGVFTATFLYAVAALPWVNRWNDAKVPFISVWFTVGLLLASVVMLVSLVQRVNRLQVNNVLSFTGDLGRAVIDAVYPPLHTLEPRCAPKSPQLPVTQLVRYSGPPRQVQALKIESLLALAERSNALIEVVAGVGDTLVESTLMVCVRGAGEAICERELIRAFKIGKERSFEQDPKYSLQLLVDIAARALSPAVNDATTAVQALDQVEDLLQRLGRRRLDIGEIRDHAGQLRVVVPLPTWDDFLELALNEIRSFGKDSMQVMRRTNALLADLISTLPEERHAALHKQSKRISAMIATSFPDIHDRREASAEDREGLGAPRKRAVDTPSEFEPAARS